MRGRIATVSAVTVFATALWWGAASPAFAGPSIQYAGRGTAAITTAAGLTTYHADSGELPSTGDSLAASSLSISVPQLLTGDTLHAATIGQGDRTRSEASLGSTVLTSGAVAISADFVMSRSSAVKHGGSVQLTAISHVDGLLVNGVPVVVTGQPNQAVPLLDGQLVINEQSTSSGGGVQSITVTALHITTSTADVVLGRSSAGVSVGSSSCSSTADRATGGGWIQPLGELKRTFGFIGGVRSNGAFHGHLAFVDHQDDVRVSGRVTSYFGAGPERTMTGSAEINGRAGTFNLNVGDNGPGSADTFNLQYQTLDNQIADTETGTLGGGNIQIHEMCS